ncbi:hypothetical protein H2201_008778 [Coniosporium apollinis]|uniref:Uncharacterized protein n=1 Tax=Coniosporium apollinis TaxID=61459 RepID=A0ABQ9NKF4_9PEZI|nr:hypothetical protein H2201_008778 [Coniosporium apollinis]
MADVGHQADAVGPQAALNRIQNQPDRVEATPPEHRAGRLKAIDGIEISGLGIEELVQTREINAGLKSLPKSHTINAQRIVVRTLLDFEDIMQKHTKPESKLLDDECQTLTTAMTSRRPLFSLTTEAEMSLTPTAHQQASVRVKPNAVRSTLEMIRVDLGNLSSSDIDDDGGCPFVDPQAVNSLILRTLWHWEGVTNQFLDSTHHLLNASFHHALDDAFGR